MDPEIIVTNLKHRFTGVSATISALLPAQAQSLRIGFVGVELPGVAKARLHHSNNFYHIGLWHAIWVSRKSLPDGRKRIWHVRRDPEMLLAIILRDVLRLPIKIVFTSAAQRFHSWFPRWLISRMDAVIATTSLAARFVNPAAIIPHGIDTEIFRPSTDKSKAWTATGLPGKYGIGMVGRIRPEKGTDLFVEAMLDLLPDFPDFTAVILGLAQPQFLGYEQQLKETIMSKGLSDRIFFKGDIPSDQMPQWYSSLLLIVACPRYEGYGLTLLEGMAAGCAPVASDTGVFRNVIEDSQLGYVVPVGDAAALASSVRKLMENIQLAKSFGECGRKYIVEKLSVDTEAANIKEVYKTIWT
jgi:mannosyltransferase